MGTISSKGYTVTSLDDAGAVTAEPTENFEFTGWFVQDENGEYVSVSEDAEFVPSELADKTFYAGFERGYEDQELSFEADGHKITATGYIPKGADLKAEKITYTESYEELINEETGESDTKFVVYDAFDITITLDDEVWQPVDDETTVKIEITGIDLPENKESAINDIQVHRIADDETEVTELDATVVEDVVAFETEHFTVFTIGSNTYDSNDATESWDISSAQDGSIMAYWYEDDARLIITGSGNMKNYSNSGTSFSPISKNLGSTTFSVEWIDADGITSIGDYAFYICTGLALTSLPDGLTSIGDCAFDGCTGLALTSLPDGLTSIGDYAFNGCTGLALTSLPDGLTSIGNRVFYNCTSLALTSLPDGLTSIGNCAFFGCTGLALTSLPDGITSIGNSVFDGCTGLTLTSLPDGLTSIGNCAFFRCTGLALTSLPESLTSIGDSAFFGCTSLALTSLPDGLTSIGNCVFYDCTSLALTSLPDGLTSIWDSAFFGCTSLALTSLPESLTSIGNYAFDICTGLALTSLPDGLTSIGDGAFYNCTGITEISYYGTLTSLGTKAFYVSATLKTTLNTTDETLLNYDWESSNRKIKKILTVNGVEYDITDADSYDVSYAQDGSLTAYYLENDNIVIISGAGSMKNYVYNPEYGGEASPIKDLSGYTVLWDDKGIYSIGDYFFAAYEYDVDNTMTMDSLPSGIVNIGQHAFAGCVNFNLEIPDTVTDIGLYAFADCSALTIDHLPDGLTNLGSQAFTRCDSITSMTLPANITTVPYMLFQQCQNLETVTLANGTTKIEGYAFSFCDKLQAVSNMDQIEEIGDSTFRGCASLQISELPATVTSLGEYAFSGCTGITEMDLSSVTGLSNIPTGTFSGCTGLENIIFQDDITSIGEYSFKDCTSLALTGLPDSLTSIGNSAFDSCEALALTSFPDGLTSIDEYAFNSCNSLTQVDLSNCTVLTNIGSNAFQHCKNLKKISLSGLTTVTVGDDAFAYCGTNNEGELVIDLSGCTGIADLSIIRSSYTAKSIDISGTSITAIPNNIFGYNWYWLESVELPDGLQSIGDHSFYNCTALAEINFEDLTALEEIGPSAFAQCYLFETLDLSNCTSLTIGQKAFEDEYRLTSLTLPAGVTVGSQAFADCYNLSEIVATGTGTIAEDSFGLMGYVNSDMNPHANYFLDGSYHSVVLPVKTTLTGDADWFDTHDFKANRRLVGDYTITLPMSIDLTYDGTGSWDIGYEVENNTNDWPVTVRPRDTNNVSVSYLSLVSEDNSRLHLSFPSDWFDGTSYDTGDNEGTLTLTTNQSLTQEKTYTGSLTFQAGIYVD